VSTSDMGVILRTWTVFWKTRESYTSASWKVEITLCLCAPKLD